MSYGLPIAALMLLVGELGVPTIVPVEVALLLTGAYAIHSVPALLMAVLLVGFIDFAGTTAMHLIAKTGGVRLLSKLIRNHEDRGREVIETWRSRVGGRDSIAIFTVRLIPVVRLYGTIASGLIQMPLKNFMLGTAPAGVIWAGTPLVIGYAFRDNVEEWEDRFVASSHLVLTIFALLVATLVVTLWMRRAASPQSAIRHARSIAGLIIAVAIGSYLTRLLWTTGYGSANLPDQVLMLRVISLILIAFVLIWFAIVDHRAARSTQTVPIDYSPKEELAPTLTWAGFVGAATVILFLLETRYSAL